MGIQGDGLHGQNFQLRLFILVFIGIMILAGILYVRGKDQEKTGNDDKTTAKEQADALKAELKSDNYQIEVQDASPTVR